MNDSTLFPVPKGMRLYTLDADRQPARATDLLAWVEWMASADKQVGDDMVGGTRVSTAFLGMDLSHHAGEPQVFETALFIGDHVSIVGRWRTWHEAEAAHKQAVDCLRQGRL